MKPNETVLLLHGIGDVAHEPGWEAQWLAPIQAALGRDEPLGLLTARGVSVAELFPEKAPSPRQIAVALGRLLGARAASWLEGGSRGMWDDFRHTLHTTAGMVVQWLADSSLRAKLRERLAEELLASNTTLLIAHSLGSLIAYDLFTQSELSDALKIRLRELWFVSLGSQLNTPWLVGNFAAGRISMPSVRRWWHLVNPVDRVFTAEIRLPGEANFTQIETEFASPPLHHDAVRYLAHPAASVIWQAWGQHEAPNFRAQRLPRQTIRPRSRPNCKALLVGIDNYPHPIPSLQGCVNDCYLVSAALQGWLFDPSDIRMVTSERATSDALRERIAWLLEDVQPGDVRVFFFAGHGAQLTGFDPNHRPRQTHECLVPYDFDWTSARSIVDDWLVGQYQQLPYDARLVLLLDCCHSGGMTRGGRNVRGLDPPDDVRHAALRWDVERELWVRRLPRNGRRGRGMGTRSLGSGSSLRTLSEQEFRKRRTELNHRGPYQPLVISACGRREAAEEYVHGSVSYGAMTFLLTKELRQFNWHPLEWTWPKLIASIRGELRGTLGISQHPYVTGPKEVLLAPLPRRARKTPLGRVFDGARHQSENASATPAADSET
jgi:hypothetical protein